MHHAERLDAHEAALREGARSAYEVAQIVWGGRLGFHEQRFAARRGARAPRATRAARAARCRSSPSRWRAA